MSGSSESFLFISDCNANVHKGCKDALPPCIKVMSWSLTNVCLFLSCLLCILCLRFNSFLLLPRFISEVITVMIKPPAQNVWLFTELYILSNGRKAPRSGHLGYTV